MACRRWTNAIHRTNAWQKTVHQVELDDAYEQAHDEWESSGDAHVWDSSTADGLS